MKQHLHLYCATVWHFESREQFGKMCVYCVTSLAVCFISVSILKHGHFFWPKGMDTRNQNILNELLASIDLHQVWREFSLPKNGFQSPAWNGYTGEFKQKCVEKFQIWSESDSSIW
jgi:hypothetical protein